MKLFLIALLALAPASLFASSSGSPLDALLSADMGWKALNFLLLLILLHVFLKKPVNNAFKASATATRDEFELTQKEVLIKEQRLQELQQKMQALEAELSERRADSLKAIEAERRRVLAEAEAQAKQMQVQVEKRIQQTLAQAKNEIRHFMVAEATKLAEEGVKRDIDGPKKQALLDEYNNSITKAG